MAKVPKPSDESIEDAELIKAVDASAPEGQPDSPLVLTEPQRADPKPEGEGAETMPPPDPEPLRAEPMAPPPRRDPPPAPRQGVFIPLVLGGALAAAGGFAASHFDLLKLAPISADTTALEATVTEQAAQIATLSAEVERLAAAPAPAPDSGLAEQLAALEAQVTGLAAAPTASAEPVDLAPLTLRLDDLESRLAAIEALPPGNGTGVAPAALAALQAELDALKAGNGVEAEELKKLADEAGARIAEAEARAAALSESLASTTAAAAARAALGRLQAALESGAPFGSALADLGDAEVPAVLADAAATGLPTLARLRDSFPAAARAALDASLRANMGESWAERVSAFLRTQTGARSLTPREGGDPDAILSRAEAALAASDVATALTEVKGLPPEGLAAMADWVATAETRLAAETAVAELVSRLGN